MKTRQISTLLAFLALATLLALTLGCPDSGGDAVPESVELRTYSVPEGHDADNIQSYIRRSLQQGDMAYGTVQKYPDGSLVVTAPPSIQRGVEDLLAELAKRVPAPAPDELSASIRYWVVLGRPTLAAAGVSFASDSLRHETGMLPVLEAIAGSQGAQEFALLERLRLSSSANAKPAGIRGARVSIDQRLSQPGPAGSLVDIDIKILARGGVIPQSLSTRVRLEPDRYVVLGQAAYNAKGDLLPEGWDPDETYLYYVISSSIE